MIPNITKGRGFRGAAEYVLSKPGAERLDCGTMLGRTPRDLAKEVAELRSGNRRLTRAVLHVSLSIAPEEKLSNQKWIQIAECYMQRMGFNNAPWFAARHTDTDHEHIHIVGIRLDIISGKTITDKQDYTRSARACQEIERMYGLRSGAMTPVEAARMKRYECEHDRDQADLALSRDAAKFSEENKLWYAKEEWLAEHLLAAPNKANQSLTQEHVHAHSEAAKGLLGSILRTELGQTSNKKAKDEIEASKRLEEHAKIQKVLVEWQPHQFEGRNTYEIVREHILRSTWEEANARRSDVMRKAQKLRERWARYIQSLRTKLERHPAHSRNWLWLKLHPYQSQNYMELSEIMKEVRNEPNKVAAWEYDTLHEINQYEKHAEAKLYIEIRRLQHDIEEKIQAHVEKKRTLEIRLRELSEIVENEQEQAVEATYISPGL